MTSPVWHPFTQHGLGDPVMRISHAEGAALYTQDGTRIIDAISSWWVTTHGHCHPKISAAIAEQAQKLDQMIFAGWTHEPAEQLARDLIAMMPAPLAYVFYSDSGSTAVEVALKMALGYWHNQGSKRNRIIVMEHSYHGDTIGAMSIGARGVFNQAYAPLLFGVDTVPFPAERKTQATLDALEAFCSAPDAPAAFIVEPLILGAGGMLVYSAEILAAMHAICTQYGVLFIADEVMTGWGRTGSLLACEQAEIVPDLLCLAKGLTGGALPLAVTLASQAIFDAHYSTDRTKTFYHSSSYTANPIACAAANANLAIWREEPVLERITDLSTRQSAQLQRLCAASTAIVNARQCGTITAFDVRSDSRGYLAGIGPQLLAFFRKHNVLLRPLGNTVYVLPPFCIDETDLDRVYAVIAQSIEEIAG
jgi:adenosylmethionine---8-amino-7-oxononanoate aminotransferase